MQSKGYKTKRGGSFGKNSIHDMLMNKKYIGIYTFGRVSGGHSEKRNSHRNSENVIELEGKLPAIIDVETFNLVQSQFTKHAPGSYTAKEIYYLSGLIHCGECGAAMSGSRVTSRGNKYSYYRCDHQQRNNSCGNARIKKDDIEKLVFDYVTERFSAENIPILTQSINQAIAESSKESIQELDALQHNKQDLTRKINNLVSAIEETGLNPIIKEKLAENQARLNEVENQIQQVSQRYAYRNMTSEQVTAILQSFSLKEKDPDEVRDILRTVIESVIVKQNEIEVIFRFALEWWRRSSSNPCPL
ncbi:recombinase family protein [Sporomusa silvacetica]|nr:recombinase family protein [Sporomusa silvacetica]